jgi:hypothetical protein
LGIDVDIVNSGTITSQDDTHITASNITNQNGVMTGNNINLNAQNTLPWMLMLSALMFRLPVTLRLLPWCLVLCELE